MMSTECPLGELSYIKIWHDNSGKDSQASWYLDHISITDLQTKNRCRANLQWNMFEIVVDLF